jgi:hypothetical protein
MNIYNINDEIEFLEGSYDYYKSKLKGKIIKIEKHLFSKTYLVDVGILFENEYYAKYHNATHVLKIKEKDIIRVID